MAGLGRLPGVDLPPRRRKQHHRQETNGKYREPPSLAAPPLTSVDLDEAAHIARWRLHKRLAYFRPSSRSWGIFSLISRNGNHEDREVCATCFESFEAEKKAMDVNCAHKSHSHCLLPWLHADPDCPYCRTPVSNSY